MIRSTVNAVARRATSRTPIWCWLPGAYPRVQHLPLVLADDLGDTPAAFATDGFHPGPALHAAFAALALDALPADLSELGVLTRVAARANAPNSPSRKGVSR